ncbi:MAG: IS4 family transposase [Anaerolineae bacterium]|nr:IS4 family transposase [Anaerolineae bacterium]
MPTNHLYDTWFQRICELRPDQRITQLRNFALLVYGIYQSRSVYLSRIAGKLPGKAKLQSTIKRLDRFLDNPALRVREWYKPIALEWLAEQYVRIGEIHLIVDGTKVGFGHQLLMISLAYRKRAIPIAWTWVKQVRGHSTGDKQIALLAYVKTLIPRGAAVFLVGDTEFGPVKVLKQLDKWHWYYVLRQKSDTLVWSETEKAWKSFGSYISKAGQSFWLGKLVFSQTHQYPVNLLAHWKFGEKVPWCLATNLPDLQTALRFYKRRMWIEEMFGDLKKHGFDLECSMLHSFLRLSRLTLAVAFLYVWLVSTGGGTIHQGLRHLVDRKDRRDLSIFQIGLRFIERRLVNAVSIGGVSLCAYF